MSSDSDQKGDERARKRTEERFERNREKVERAEAKVREHSEQAQAKIARALEGVAAAEDRAGERVARAIERAERAGEAAAGARVPGGDEVEPLIWFRQEPASRRPAHKRADIARAALEIADTEGFDAVSMRRVAQRLGAGTMTLYHYVRNKGELIALMSDAVMAEVVVPEGELSDDWRTALTQIANRSHDAFRAHHWIFQRMGDDGAPGPNGMRHFEQSLQAVAGLGLGREQTFEVIGQIDDYVFGYSLRELQEAEEQEHGWSPEVVDFFRRELATGAYPLIGEFFGDDFEASFDEAMQFMADETRFDRGLARLLDGIEAEFAPK
ncbi:MAG TPA: TetR/AcrR family transcriptional regulator C-terminal domain-containing protein [Solirubrobacterales bacterium]|nr:TetR/AcrR family transcriptional regulator C-terminal domain-containing protein [Solirubrobacterales bacterium]